MPRRPQLWIDFETGGRDPFTHSPLSIAMIGVSAQGAILGEYYRQLRFQPMIVEAEALNINKIDLREPGLTLEQFQTEYWQHINGWFYDYGNIQPNRDTMPVRGGHNLLPFDNFILEKYIGNWNASFSYSIDTLAIALALREMGLIDPPNLKLGTLVQYFNIPIEGELHNALVDLRATLKVWEKLQEVIRGRSRQETIPIVDLFGGTEAPMVGF